ncbi:YbdD/YjiX family protein [Georgenia sp. SYP-B2076]|uniref:YbdD/YjiX family protein n=1 Tax=Georgenia sp. SYP-B2076 TaxID=2495881 RepID=UPI001F0C99E9|nr:YbdD/YjiX family protein [Georgenia sp. SYP-B2076]
MTAEARAPRAATSAAGAPGTEGTARAATVRAARAVRWYVRALMGDGDYERYVAYLRRAHPDAEVPTEKEFWCRRWAEQEANPGARCC